MSSISTSTKFSFNLHIIIIILYQCILIFGNTIPLVIKDNTRRQEILDTDGIYVLLWENDFETQRITFQVIVKTLGFIGFGISPNGGMTNADIVIGGVHRNGSFYFFDYFSKGQEKPEIDLKQDWSLLDATENGTHTMLKFQRLFDTCDKNDFKIGNDTSYVIWSFGKSDVINYHSSNRGSYSINLLDPPIPSFDTSTVSKWRVSNDYKMPPDDTTYWCTMHKSPVLVSKHHIVGFEPYLPTIESKRHTHHFIVHDCNIQETTEKIKNIFDNLMNSQGDHCYKPGNASKLLQSYCQSYLFVWAVGGKMTIYPEHVGYPINEGNSQGYFMLQVHYNNPSKLKDVKFDAGVNIFHTSKLREFEADTLVVANSVSITQLIPPRTKSFMSVGHCSSECTSTSVPSSGLNVFNVLLHSHLAGRKIKLRHYRDGNEIAWLSNDDNYDFNFQQNRPLKSEIKILPSDQLTIECTYDTSSRENVTIGGFSSADEMCQAFIIYYPRIDMWLCISHYTRNATLQDFGIEKTKAMIGTTDELVIAPKEHEGKTYTEVLNEINWTPDKVEEFQKRTRFSNHNSICRSKNSKKQTVLRPVTYPLVKEDYVLPDTCGSY